MASLNAGLRRIDACMGMCPIEQVEKAPKIMERELGKTGGFHSLLGPYMHSKKQKNLTRKGIMHPNLAAVGANAGEHVQAGNRALGMAWAWQQWTRCTGWSGHVQPWKDGMGNSQCG